MRYFRGTRKCGSLSVLLLAVLVTAAFVLRANGHDDVIETFAVPKNGDALIVPVRIDDEERLFLIDTGFTFNVFDKSLRAALDPIDLTATLNESASVHQVYQCRHASVGRSRLPVAGGGLCLDLSGFRDATGYEIQGILGMEFLRQVVVVVDFDAGRVSLLKSSKHAAGRAVRLAFDPMRRPTVSVQLPGVGNEMLLIDTGMVGCFDGKLVPELVDVLTKAKRMEIRETQGHTMTVDGVMARRVGILREFSLEEFRHEDQIFGDGTVNAIGLGYLSRYKVTFDFPKRRMFLEKGAQFDKHFRVNAAGIEVTTDHGIVTVRNIHVDGTAHESGVRIGDQLLAINGRATSALTLFEVRAALRSGSREIRLTLWSPGDNAERNINLEIADHRRLSIP